MTLTPTLQLILFSVVENIAGRGYARGVQIAEDLNLSRPTVTRGLQDLDAAGMINLARYRGVALRDKGQTYARNFGQMVAGADALLKPLKSLPPCERRIIAARIVANGCERLRAELMALGAEKCAAKKAA